MGNEPTKFFAGVVEGFYGPPWSSEERSQLFTWMSAWGLNTYFYAPKDDLKHRAIWRELYTDTELQNLAQLIKSCQQHGLKFIYGLSPGLDIRYRDAAELDHLQKRFAQLQAIDCQHFALLFDDIPDRLDERDIERWGSLAAAQSFVANSMFRWIRERTPSAQFLFCPTPYCGRMAERELGGANYLQILGRELSPEIEIFWTGPEIISRTFSVEHITDLQHLLRRKPIIWDNLHANDYDGRRFFCGPYSGRPPALRDAVNGVLVNPNNEFPLNYVPLRTFAEFVQSGAEWQPRKAYLAAMKEWHGHFATVTQSVTLDDLTLFGDCYYLPHEEGEGAQALFKDLQNLISTIAAEPDVKLVEIRKRAARLRDFCARMVELHNRPLFYALSRRVWELREELDLLDRYLEYKSQPSSHIGPFTSDFHQPGNYRGGFVARLQKLLRQNPDGTFSP